MGISLRQQAVLFPSILLTLASISTTPAKDFAWAFRVGEAAHDCSFNSIVARTPNDLMMLGQFGGNLDVDPGPGTVNFNSTAGSVCVLRLDGAGQFVEAGQLGGGTSLATDPAGQFVYVSGTFDATRDLDPGPGTVSFSNAGGQFSDDGFVSKAGATTGFPFQFAAQFSSAGTSDWVDARAVTDSQGNTFLAGTFTGAIDFDPGSGTTTLVSAGSKDAYIAKLTATGALAWVRRIGSAGDQAALSLAVDPSGSIVVAGVFTGSVDFDPGPGTFTVQSAGGNDGFVVKLDGAGSFVWAGTLAGTGNQWLANVAVDPSSNVYLVGSHNGTTDFDPGPGTFSLSASTETGYVVKLDGTGSLLWAVHGIGELASLVAVDSTGKVNVAGNFHGTRDFDPGDGIWSLTSASPSFSDVFVVELSSTGSLMWAGRIGGTDIDLPYGIAIDASDATYVVGMFKRTVDFDPGPGVTSLTSVSPILFFSGFALKLVPAANPDVDQDGVPDASDNCPLMPNAAQSDSDGDQVGDACDPCPNDVLNDPDQDGVCGSSDNCPDVSNASQTDTDGDGIGDYCDSCPSDVLNDPDADGLCGGVDNCPDVSDWTRLDTDFDGLGDVCDPCPTDPASQDSRVFARDVTGYARILPGPAGSLYEFGTDHWQRYPGQDATITRRDASGAALWTTQLTHAADYGAVDGAGNLIVTAVSWIPCCHSGGVTMVSKIDPSGAVVWTRQVGTVDTVTIVQPTAIAADAAGNVYVFGAFNGTQSICGQTLSLAGSTDVYVCSLDSAGQFGWVRQMTGSVFFADAEADASGNLYAGGAFSGTVDFDPGAGSFPLTSAGAEDGFVLRLSASGDFGWAERLGHSGSDRVFSLALAGSGAFFVVGEFSATVDLDPGPGVANASSAGSYDAFVLKLLPTGDLTWARAFGGPGADSAYAVAVGADGSATSAGSFEGSVDFDSGSGTKMLASAGAADGFVMTLDPAGAFRHASAVGGPYSDAVDGVVILDGSDYIVGAFGAVADFDPGPGVFELIPGHADSFIAKLPASDCADADQDGVCDADDNCPGVANTDQASSGCGAEGDACCDGDGDGRCATDCDDQNPATYPQAPEYNDGLDNQCPGEPGFGMTDEVTGVSGFYNAANRDEYSWPPQGGATTYQVARSGSAQFGSGTCTLTAVSQPAWVDGATPASAEAFYYLVRATAPFPGSWGAGSNGVERAICP